MAAPIVLGITIRSDGTAQVNRDLDGVRGNIDRTARSANEGSRMFAEMARQFKAMFAIGSLAALAKEVFDVNREFQSLRTSLASAVGGMSNAKQAFAFIQDFAAKTPYDVAQVTEAFIKLKNLGLTPSKEALRSYGNTASSQSKPLMQMIEAVADAATGEFERLKEFGIQAAAENGKVAFTFQGVTTTVTQNAAEIEKYLISLGNNKFGDAMAAQSKTVNGALSNLGDAWSKTLDDLINTSGEQKIAGVISALADNLHTVADAVITLGEVSATVYASKILPSLASYVSAKYIAITTERAHAAAITMDLERTVALTAAELANTTATVASVQATLASTTSMTARMAAANQLNAALLAQAQATAAATAATDALAISSGAASLTLKSLFSAASMLNVALAAMVGWEIGSFLNKFESVRRVANDALYSILTGIENVTYYWDRLKAVMSGNSGQLDGLKAAHVIQQGIIGDLISANNSYVLGADKVSAAMAQQSKLLKEMSAQTGKASGAQSDAAKEAEKLQEQYDKLTLSTEAYNKKHAQGLSGSPEEIAKVERLSNAIDKLNEEKKALTKSTSEAANEAKKAAHEDETFWSKAKDFLITQADQLNLLKLSSKEKSLETEISKNLNQALGEAYDKTKVYSEAKQTLIDEVINNTKQISAETEALARQQAMWDETVKQANELDQLHDDTVYVQYLANMAKELHLAGLTNEEISKRIGYEKEVQAALEAHPDLDPAKVKGYIKAQQDAADEIKKYSDESSKWMEAAFKKAVENIHTSFANMFENMLNGDALDSIKKFADNIKKTINQAISQQLALDLQNLFTGKGGLGDMFKSAMLFGISLLTSVFSKTPEARTLSPSEVGNSPVLGTGAMHIADSFTRDAGYQYQSQSIIAFNKSLDYATSTIMGNVGKITDWIGAFGTKLASFSVVSQVAEFFRPITSMIGKGLSSMGSLYSSVTSFINTGITAVSDFVGLTTAATASFINSGAAWSTGIQNGTHTFAGGVQAADAAGSSASNASTALSNVGVALSVIKFGYDMYQTWGNDALTLHTKITNSLYAMSDAMLTAAASTMNWPLAVAAAVLNVAGVVSDVLENGFSKSNMLRLFLGPLAGLFNTPRTPNAWMNTYNEQGNQAYQYNPNAGVYTHTGNKDAHIGVETPFGMTVISTHEMSLTVDEMKNAFGRLLDTVKAVDVGLYDTINAMDAKFGETGKTMDYYNNLLRDGNPGVSSVSTNQDASSLDTGAMLQARYSWITDKLAESGSKAGQYINALFDTLTAKISSVSTDTSLYVLGTIDMISKIVPSMMELPLSVIDLIGQSVKSLSVGTVASKGLSQLSDEILNVVGTIEFVNVGLKQLGMGGEQNAVIDGIAKFLTSINAIGFEVKDAGINLIAYAVAMQKVGGVTADAVEFMHAANAKFTSLKGQGLDNSQISAYFGTFGLMAKMFAEAGVAFKEADLDGAAKHLHDTAKASVEVAKNTIDHAIATEKLTNVTREAAIATLVKTGKLDEATVAEAEYGVSIQGATKDLLAQMGFIQQLGFVSGKTLSQMGISADTWVNAAKNVVTVFGDMQKAMEWLDSTAKTFLSPKDYAKYNLDTIDRNIANIKDSTPSLAGINEASISEAFKSGAAGLVLITELAKQAGGEAATIKALVDLYGQRITTEKSLKDAMGETAKRGLEIQLMEAQGHTTESLSAKRKEELAVMDASLRGLQEQIWSAQDAAAAAYKQKSLDIALMDAQGLAYDSLIAKRKQEIEALEATAGVTQKQIDTQKAIYTAQDAAKTQALQIELLNAQGNVLKATNLQRQNEIKAISATDQAIKQQIYAAQDANARRKLEIDLLTALGAAESATAATRADALKGLDAYSQSLQKQIWAAQDAKVIADQRTGIENKLLQTLNNTAEIRQRELNALNPANRALQQNVYLLEDMVAAVTKANTGIDAAFSKLQRAVDAERKTLTASYDAQSKAIKDNAAAQAKAAQDNTKAAQDNLSAVQSIFSKLGSALNQINDGPLTMMQRTVADATLSAAAASARAGGSLANYAGLEDALAVVTKPSQDLYASLADWQLAQAKTAGVIEELRSSAGSQVSVAQATVDAITSTQSTIQSTADAAQAALEKAHAEDMTRLDNVISTAQAQIDAIRGVDTSVVSVADAVNGLSGALGSYQAAIANQIAAVATATNSLASSVSASAAAQASSAAAAAAQVSAMANTAQASTQVASSSGGGGMGGVDNRVATDMALFLTQQAIYAEGRKPVDQQSFDVNAAQQALYGWYANGAQFGTDAIPSLAGVPSVADLTAQYDAANAASLANKADILQAGLYAGGLQALDAIKAGQDAAIRAGSNPSQDLYRELISVPQFAVGTNYIPQDMLAMVHKGEAVVPERFNPAAFFGVNNSGGNNIDALIKEIKELKIINEKLEKRLEKIETNTGNTSTNTGKLADQFGQVTEGGNKMRVEVL